MIMAVCLSGQTSVFSKWSVKSVTFTNRWLVELSPEWTIISAELVLSQEEVVCAQASFNLNFKNHYKDMRIYLCYLYDY